MYMCVCIYMVYIYIYNIYGIYMGFPGDSDGKEFACNVGDLGLIPGLGRSPRGGHGNQFQYSCLENPHGLKLLAGLSSQGKEEATLSS